MSGQTCAKFDSTAKGAVRSRIDSMITTKRTKYTKQKHWRQRPKHATTETYQGVRNFKWRLLSFRPKGRNLSRFIFVGAITEPKTFVCFVPFVAKFPCLFCCPLRNI